MTLNQLLNTMGDQLAGIAEGWRREAPLEWLQARHERLGRDLRRRYDLLISQRAVIQGLRHRVDVAERRVQILAERAQIFLNLRDGDNAWRNALELDRIRIALEREREQLAFHEDNYAEQRRDIDAIKLEMANLRERMERHYASRA
jgi:hypothetical protein